MAKKKRSKSSPRRTHLRSMPTTSEGQETDPGYDQPFLQELRRALRTKHPIDFMALVSSVVCASHPAYHPHGREGVTAPFDELVDSFVGTDIAETTAALHVLTRIVPDELFAARLRKVLATRREHVPAWIAEMDDASVVRTEIMTHVLGDGDNYLFDVRLADGAHLSAVVYVDHNLGTVVKDAFFIPEDLTRVIQKYEELMDPEQSIDPVDAATARAVVMRAIEDGALVEPPLEGETWPQCRPLVEWVLRLLPTGGTPPGRATWTEAQLDALVEEFMASRSAARLGPDDRGLVELLMTLNVDLGTGDPLRWTPVNVEILLMQWLPELASGTDLPLSRMPEVLRSWVPWCHQRQGVLATNTDETLASVDHFEPAYGRIIDNSERIAHHQQLIDVLRGEELDDDERLVDIMLAGIDDAVGGREATLSLDDDPLPHEPFDWSRIPEDVHDRVAEVLHLAESFCDQVLDTEHRTAVRRLLARSAATDPAIFRRRSSPERAAAAVCWVICRANETIGRDGFGPLQTQELLEWFDLTGSVSQRAEVFLKAIGVDPHDQWGGMDLGSVDYLVSRQRGALIDRRDRYHG